MLASSNARVGEEISTFPSEDLNEVLIIGSLGRVIVEFVSFRRVEHKPMRSGLGYPRHRLAGNRVEYPFSLYFIHRYHSAVAPL